MALTYLSAATANAMMQAAVAAATNYYQSLHTASPGTSGANEASGGTGPYARQTIQFGSASSGVVTSTTAQTYPGMPAITATHFGEWDAASAGNYKLGGPLTSSLTVPAGATVSFAIGAVSLTTGG